MYKIDIMNRFLPLFLIGIFTAFSVQAQTTPVSDTLKTSETWTVANSPYQVTADVIIDNGVTLTIEPGVEVQFDSGTSLLVDGALVADGTDADSIRFTSSAASKAPGDWNTIRFNNTSNVGSVIDHVIVEYGGAGSGGALLSYTTGAFAVNITNSEFKFSNVHGIDLRASSPDIQNSTFRDNNGYGIFSDFSLSYTVDTSTIIRNGQGGIRVPINAAPTITASVIDTNGTGIYMDNGSTADVQNNNIRGNNIGIRVIEAGSNSPLIEDNSIEGNSTWGLINEGVSGVKAEYNYWGARSGPSNLTNPAGIGDKVSDNVDFDPWLSGTANLPIKDLTLNFSNNDTLYADTVYVVSNNLSLATNDTLYIEPGTNIKFESGRYMTINGTMYADGKVDSVIAFTSVTDDVYGGDTNGDGRNSMPQPGEWNYLRLSNSGTSSVLNYVNVRYAGSGSTALRIESPSVQLTNMFVDNNLRTGVSITDVPVVFENIVSNANGDHGFVISTSVDVKNIVAQRNTRNGLFVNVNSGSSFTVSIDSSEFSYNNDHGLYIDNYNNATAVVDSITNSVFSFNSEIGLNMLSGNNSAFYLANNTVEGNGDEGAHIYIPGATTENVEIIGNTFLNNNSTGLRTSGARLYGNHFEGNNFGLGIWGLVEFNYENLSGTDDNTFANNRYAKAVELNGRHLNGTLSSSLPADIAVGGSYMFNEYSSTNVDDGDVLTIEPGTLIKMLQNQDLTVAGTLIAQGTSADSIKFTSYRDDEINNNNNNPVSDTTSAKRGDHYGINLYNPDAAQTIMEYVVVKYATTGLRINSGGSFANDFNYLTVQHSSSHGIEVNDATLTIDNSLIENSRYDGIYARSNKTSLPTGELTVRNSIIRNNGDNGIENGRGSSSSYLYYSLKELSNTTISGNGDNGVYLNHPPSAVSFVGNTIEENGQFGAWIFHRNMDLNDISIAGNMFRNNGKAGVRSSSAKFIDNTFEGNEFGISLHGKLGYQYVDDVGTDGNEFINNTYNNALEFYPQYVKDTLSSRFPEQITSGVYMMGSASGGVINNDTLFIDAGVIIKSGHDSSPDLEVNSGMMLSLGTKENPVIFTSYRDDNYGGKTSAVGDTTSPAPGDWYGIYVNPDNSGENTHYTDLSNIIVKYGYYNIRVSGNQDIVPVWTNIQSSDANYTAFELNSLAATIDSSSFNNSRVGINLYNYDTNPRASLTLRNSEVLNNQDEGIITRRGSSSSYVYAHVRELSKSTVSNNGREGIHATNAAVPMTFQFNTIENNNGHGIYATVTSAATTDTVLTIAGNKIRNNTGIGILSSRANIVSDTLEGNAYPIGVTGILSKPNTINDQGNFYQDNVIQNNDIDSVTAVTGYLHGVLGGTKPTGYTQNMLVSTSNLDVASGDSLVVKPGTMMKLSSGHYLYNRGTMLSVGEVDKKIVFTSIKDDTYGGNTNGDTTNVVPSPGDWNGIRMYDQSSDSSIIKNTIIRYANDNLYFYGSDALVDSSAFSYANNSGIYINNSSNPTVRSSDLHDNRYGSYINSGNPVYQLNNIYDNEYAGLVNRTSNTILATNNYWGHESGPLVENGPDLNPDGQGDKIDVQNGAVEYDPWQTGRNGILLGDVTLNGTISAFDASNVLQHTTGAITLTGNALAAGDVNASGTVSAMDASYVLQFVVGNISGFPGQGKQQDIDFTESITLAFEEGKGYTDISLSATGEASLQAAEFELQLANNHIKEVEFIGNDSGVDFNMEYHIDGENINVALAGVASVKEAMELGNIRLIHEDDAKVNNTSEQLIFDKFVVNDADITEFVKENFSPAEKLSEIPEEFDLKQNYPNPFNPTTNIAYDLPQSGKVTLKVYNMLGQLVQTVVDERQKAGAYTFRWDAAQYSSGTYLLRIEFNGDDKTSYSEVRKMLLIK